MFNYEFKGGTMFGKETLIMLNTKRKLIYQPANVFYYYTYLKLKKSNTYETTL